MITTKMSRHIIIKSIDQINGYGTIDSLANEHGFKKVGYCIITEDKNGKEVMKSILSEKKKKQEWIYIITVDNFILKAGGTADGIGGRFGSYRAGTIKNRENGTCSVTNYIVQQSILNMIRLGHKVEIYGYKVPSVTVNLDVFGLTKEIKTSIFKQYEETIFNILEQKFGSRPILSLN